MTFSRTKSTSVAPLIELNGHIIRSVSSFRFLGIYLDPKLLGHSHINFLIQKANKLINVIRSLCGTWWGSDPRLLLGIYKSLVTMHPPNYIVPGKTPAGSCRPTTIGRAKAEGCALTF